MSKWGQATAKERRDAPADIFCGPNRTFPVADQADLNNLVSRLNSTNHAVGPIKSCAIGKARSHGWSIPDTWKANNAAFSMVGETPPPSGQNTLVASFSSTDLTKFGEVTLADGGSYVIRRGKVFVAGKYPDKNFEATPEDLVIASLNFKPVPNRVQHIDPAKYPTFFDGHLGELRSLALAEDGETLMGEMAVPTWFDSFMREHHSDKPFSVSLEFDRVTKNVVGNTILPNPRIADSDLVAGMAEFAGHKGVQTLHDMTVAHGAACKNDDASMAMTHDDVIQRFHDATVAHGANCLPAGDAQAGDGKMSLANMGVGDFFRAILTGKEPTTTPHWVGRDPTKVTLTPDRVEETAVSIDKAAFDAMEQRLKAAESTNQTLLAVNRRQAASALVDRLIVERRILPGQRESLIRFHVATAEDDAAAPKTVTFAKGDTEMTGSRLEALEAVFSAMPQHTLTVELVQELIKDGKLAEVRDVMQTARMGEEPKSDAARVDKLLAHTGTGQQILAERNGKN